MSSMQLKKKKQFAVKVSEIAEAMTTVSYRIKELSVKHEDKINLKWAMIILICSHLKDNGKM